MVREIAHEASTGSLGTSLDPIRLKDGEVFRKIGIQTEVKSPPNWLFGGYLQLMKAKLQFVRRNRFQDLTIQVWLCRI